MLLDGRLPFVALQACRLCLKPTITVARPFSTSSFHLASLGDLGKSMDEVPPEIRELALTKIFGEDYRAAFDPNIPDRGLDEVWARLDEQDNRARAQPHHLNVYATKHNTHISLTTPERNNIISKSTGNIGFRKAARGTYDAAYQLSAFILGQIYEQGMLNKIKKLEIVLRGFGVGREAVTKALLGAEGRKLRPVITQVTDATRLKFGGTRGKKPRRLG